MNWGNQSGDTSNKYKGMKVKPMVRKQDGMELRK